MSELKVLYEDNHLIAVYKPHGVLVQGDRTGNRCLMDDVKDNLKEKYQKPGNVFLGLLHRIDRPVAGIVLFAKTSKGASRLSEQIRDRAISKQYTVLVSPVPKVKSAKLVHYMIKNQQKNKSWAHEEFRKGAKEAVLNYSVSEEREDGTALLKVDLHTGRHHQIRAQMAAIGSPIVGDSKYGSRKGLARLDRICLCATRLEFKKATEDETVVLECEAEF
jgi:23S rRNA pseudouridine1911/1915/1917 synthase